MQESVLVYAFRFMLGTHRIVRAQLTEVQGVVNMLVDTSAHLNQSTERSFGVRGAGVEQNAVANTWHGVDALSNRTCRITAFQSDSRNEQVRERMQHQMYGIPGNSAMASLMLAFASA